MKRKKNVIRQVAQMHNVSEEEVKREMQAAIHEAIQSNDPEVKRRWSKSCKNGKEPTPEELLQYLSHEVRRKTKYH